MARFTKDSIERVREAVDMVELVGHKTDLRRMGSQWLGLCPFHDERSPSFSVDPERRLYYCFGCSEGGDAIRFVEKTEALDFPDAVELLGERYNVRIEREEDDPRSEQRRRRRERLMALVERSARFYATYLWEAAEAARAREYLASRGLSEEVLREFRVGFSPSAGDRLTAAAARDGFSEEELIAGGLSQRGRGLYDRFRGRIMFPLADARGRVLGFGARALEGERPPKYLNTSENEIYHKGRQLFGIDLARSHAAKSGRIVAVEGYTDVLALHQAGLPEAVAIMGTALTQDQMAELSKAAPLVVLALDADRSGQEAMLRAARVAKDRDVDLRVVELPEGSDPADLVGEGGAEAFNARLKGAVTVLEFQVRRVLADADTETPAGRDRALEQARPLIAATLERTAMRDSLVREVADRLDVPMEYVTAQIAAPAGPSHSNLGPRPQATAGSPGAASLAPDQAFLVECLASGELGREYLAKLDDDHLSSELTRKARAHLVSHFEDRLADLAGQEPDVAKLVARVALEADDRGAAREPELRLSYLALELRKIDREVRRAGQQGDKVAQNRLAEARRSAKREIETVFGQMA
ncbi:MAG TPA: DNA primase [Thermoleophilaceae bacterium]|nr:DNA primase [Thermoleophilaceae bacterium]